MNVLQKIALCIVKWVHKKCIMVCKEIAKVLASIKQPFPEGNCKCIASLFANVMQKISDIFWIYYIWSYEYHILQRFALCTVKLMQKIATNIAKCLQLSLQNICNGFTRLEANLLHKSMQVHCKPVNSNIYQCQ